jgi:hypothetical protein
MASIDQDGHIHVFDDNAEDHCDHKVPNRGQFAPGKSGNPKGRPRKVVKQQSAIQTALSEVATITDANAASPNFLTEVIKAESNVDGEGFLRRFVQAMSEEAISG